jgi:hypothetical protein
LILTTLIHLQEERLRDIEEDPVPSTSNVVLEDLTPPTGNVALGDPIASTSNEAPEEHQSQSTDVEDDIDVDEISAQAGRRITLWQAFGGRGPFGSTRSTGQYYHSEDYPAYPYAATQTGMPSQGTCTIPPEEPSGSSHGPPLGSHLQAPQPEDESESDEHPEEAEQPARPPLNKGKGRATDFDLN